MLRECIFTSCLCFFSFQHVNFLFNFCVYSSTWQDSNRFSFYSSFITSFSIFLIVTFFFISFEKGSFWRNTSLNSVFFYSFLLDDRTISSAKSFKCETKMRHKSTVQIENETDKRCLGDKRLVGFERLIVQLVIAVLASEPTNRN